MLVPAIVFTGPSTVAIRDVEVPPPGPGQVQIRTTYSTISSGTEGWALQNQFTWQATPYPCVPGYQRVGHVTALGPGVEGFAIGQRVAATIGIFEGPVHSQWGAHASVTNTPVHEIYKLIDSINDLDASALVVAQVGYNAAYRPHFRPYHWYVVYGDGIIGQFAAQSARARGGRVILVGHRPERLQIGLNHSAHAVVNNKTQNLEEAVKKIVGDTSVIVLDTIQSEAAQREYLPLLKHGEGQIVYAGFTPGKAWADMGLLQQRELTTHFISGWNRERMQNTRDLMAKGAIRTTPLITHQVPFHRGPDMYQMILQKSAPFMGITLDWTGA